MKKFYCFFLLLAVGFLCFAQTLSKDTGNEVLFGSSEMKGALDYSPSFTLFRPVPLADGQETQNQTIFANSPQWVKDLRRAEIVMFGSFPITLFFTRFFMDFFRTASHDWDRRYAPWPFKGPGAVLLTTDELKRMFTIAVSASLIIAVTDHIVVKHKRKAAAAAIE